MYYYKFLVILLAKQLSFFYFRWLCSWRGSGKKILVQKSDWPSHEEKMASRTRNGGAKATEGSSGGRDGAADSGRRVSCRLSTKGDKILLSPDDIK